MEKCNRIQFSSPLQSIAASLSSSFDSGAHSVLLFSVVGYHYRSCTDGVRAYSSRRVYVDVLVVVAVLMSVFLVVGVFVIVGVFESMGARIWV